MAKVVLPRIDAVEACESSLTIQIRLGHGGSDIIDVSNLVNTFTFYAPLRDDPGLFHQARVGEHGTDIVWTDTIDMPNDTLWRLAQELSGAAAPQDAFNIPPRGRDEPPARS